MKELENVFYVVTQSGGVHKVYLTETEASVEKIFVFNPLQSKVGVGYILGPEKKFVGITKWCGLWKFSSENNKKPEHFNEGRWEGTHIHTSLIVGLFFDEVSAIKFCEEKYGQYNTKEWYLQETSINVMYKIKDHPLVLVE